MSALAELTQTTIARLRSTEFNMRIVQLQPSTASASSALASSNVTSEIDIATAVWKSRHGSSLSSAERRATGATTAATAAATTTLMTAPTPTISLPTSLIDYYKALQTDGLYFAASVGRSSGTANGVEASAYVCCCKLNRIGDIVPVQVDASKLSSSCPPWRSRSPSGAAYDESSGKVEVDSSTATSTAAAATDDVSCFLLAAGSSDVSTSNGVDGPKSILVDIILVYRARGPFANPEVWGRTTGTATKPVTYFYLCRCVEDYLRLSCRMHWVAGWQLCFDDDGPPSWALPWLRMLAPGPLLAALRT